MTDLAGGSAGPAVRVAGRYLLGEPIGAGGMGRVYRARDEVLDRDVALKLLNEAETGDGRAWLAEARAAAKLAHPGVARVFDSGLHEGRGFIVAELVGGRALDEILRERGPLASGEAIELAARLADALDDAHRHGIIHCDIKPQNVVVTPEGEPKLVDFGIARLATTAGAATAELVVGSAPYLAPEQVSGGPIDGRADLYALGAVLYELLTGRPPFEGLNAAAVMYRRLVADPPPPRSLNSSVSPELERIVLRALARDPSERYARAADFRDALRAVAAGARERTVRLSAAAVTPAASRRPAIAIPRPGIRRAGLALIAAAILLLGLLVSLAGQAGRTGPRQVAVPDLVGRRISEVPPLLEQAGLVAGPVQTRAVERERVATVVEQDPTPGRALAAGGEVRLVVGVPR